MKRTIFIILTLFLFFINITAEASTSLMKKDIKAVSKDGFNVRATLTYPKNNNQKDYATVILLHSLGYNSQWWGDLPKELLSRGYAVLAIDLRGHGNSIYNSRFAKLSWKNLKNSGYAKYPTDIIAVIDEIKKENTAKQFFNNWALVGADIGASAGIIAADKMKSYPEVVVMISPVVETKGVYIPVSVAHLETSDFLAILGTDDTNSADAAGYLSKFAQNQFVTFTSNSKTTGMMMIKNDPGLANFIAEWVSEYLN